MKFITISTTICTLLSLTLARRETQAEAIVHARELIQYRAYNTGVLMTTYQETTAPFDDLLGLPIGLLEYYTMHPDGSGDLILLAMPISSIYKNAISPYKPNMTMTISDQYGFGDGNLATGRARIALFGSLSAIPSEDIPEAKAAYLIAHPDARAWIPPRGPHDAFFSRLTVDRVYCVDGFGNVAYIGWLPLEEYRAAGKKMRSEKEVRKHWPVPRQPEGDELVDASTLFLASEATEEIAAEGRLRIQL